MGILLFESDDFQDSLKRKKPLTCPFKARSHTLCKFRCHKWGFIYICKAVLRGLFSNFVAKRLVNKIRKPTPKKNLPMLPC